jgi:hypothetical protein
MNKRSPARIIELCVYVLIIVAAVIWMLTGGRLYNPPDIPPPPTPTQTENGTGHIAAPATAADLEVINI